MSNNNKEIAEGVTDIALKLYGDAYELGVKAGVSIILDTIANTAAKFPNFRVTDLNELRPHIDAEMETYIARAKGQMLDTGELLKEGE
jgi:hypothetical protein